jgi:hypothetical protein
MRSLFNNRRAKVDVGHSTSDPIPEIAPAPTADNWRTYWRLVNEAAQSEFSETSKSRQEILTILSRVSREPADFAADVREHTRKLNRWSRSY